MVHQTTDIDKLFGTATHLAKEIKKKGFVRSVNSRKCVYVCVYHGTNTGVFLYDPKTILNVL